MVQSLVSHQFGSTATMSWEGLLFLVDEKRYIFVITKGHLLCGKVLLDGGDGNERNSEVKDQDVVAKIQELLANEDRVWAARRARAQAWAAECHGGNVLAEGLFFGAIQFANDEPQRLELDVPGFESVDWYQLGCNASHDFYAGMKEGRLFRCASGYEEEPDVEEIDSLDGYWGHF